MPRRKTNTVTVTAYPKLRNGRLYHGRIKMIRHQRGQHRLHLEIENLDHSQCGRVHALDLPLPVRPGNRASALLLACGCEACRIGAVIDLDAVVGHVIGLRFRGQDTDGNEQFDFEKIATPSGHQIDTMHEERGVETPTSEENATGPESDLQSPFTYKR